MEGGGKIGLRNGTLRPCCKVTKLRGAGSKLVTAKDDSQSGPGPVSLLKPLPDGATSRKIDRDAAVAKHFGKPMRL